MIDDINNPTMDDEEEMYIDSLIEDEDNEIPEDWEEE